MRTGLLVAGLLLTLAAIVVVLAVVQPFAGAAGGCGGV